MALRDRIEDSWEAGELDAESIEEAIGLLDRGEVRVAEPRTTAGSSTSG